MATTQIASLVIPQVWQDLIITQIPVHSNLLASGKARVVPQALSKISKGDQVSRVPWLPPLTSTGDEETLVEGTPMSTSSVTGFYQEGFIVDRGKAWSFSDLASLKLGANLIDIYVPLIAQYAGLQIEKTMIATIKGAFSNGNADSLGGTNNASAFVHALTNANITLQAINEAKALKGEAQEFMDTMYVHTDIHTQLVNQGLVQYVDNPALGQQLVTEGVVRRTAGMNIVVNDLLCAPRTAGTNTIYDSFLAGGVPFSVDFQRALRIETDRDPKNGGGVDEVIYTNHYQCHVQGTTWAEAGSTRFNPANADIESGTINKLSGVDNTLIPITKLQLTIPGA